MSGAAIVIPARNAAATLAETLASLQAQTHGAWKAIVVDDGSTDATAQIAASFAASDARIRVRRQARRGEGGARNVGVARMRSEWLLFLDADDWLEPDALERLLGAAVAVPDADVVCGGWVRITPSGERIEETHRPGPGEVFATLARYNPFAIHSCLVRRSTVLRAGRFDPRLQTCADWDLWQRVARTGARFHMVPEIVARYRVRPGSASAQAVGLLADGLRQIRLGHHADARLRAAAPAFREGAARADLNAALLTFACWPAGLVIGAGEDAARMLDAVADVREPRLPAGDVAHTLFRAIAVGAAESFSRIARTWPHYVGRVTRFLDRLETISRAPALTAETHACLASLVDEHDPDTRSVQDEP